MRTDELQELLTYAKVHATHNNKPLYQTLQELHDDAAAKQNHLLAWQYDLLAMLYKGADYSATLVRGTLWQIGQYERGVK